MRTNILATLSLAALPLITVACGQPGEESMPMPMEEGDTATAVSALCTDAGAANYSAALIMGDVGGTVSSTSPSGSYGSALCSGRYVVEATATAGKPNLLASASYADTALTQNNCASGSVSLIAYGFNPATNAWVQVGAEQIASGVFEPSPFGGPGSCSVAAGINVPSTYSKVRVAAKATLNTVFGPLPRKVTGTVFAHY